MTVVVHFHSGCALMIIEGLIKSCRTSIKKRRMYDTCSSRAYHSERKCKKLDIHIYHLHATGAYIFDADSFDVGRSPFTTITSWNSRPPAVFLSQSGAHQSATCQKGVKSYQKGSLPSPSKRRRGIPLGKHAKKGYLLTPQF